jgi:hypothetical protein
MGAAPKIPMLMFEHIPQEEFDMKYLSLAIVDGPSEMDVMRSLFDGLLVDITVQATSTSGLVTITLPTCFETIKMAGEKFFFIGRAYEIDENFPRIRPLFISRTHGFLTRRGKREGFLNFERPKNTLILEQSSGSTYGRKIYV